MGRRQLDAVRRRRTRPPTRWRLACAPGPTRWILTTGLLLTFTPAGWALAASDPANQIEAIVDTTLAEFDRVVDDLAGYLITAVDPDRTKTVFDTHMAAIAEARSAGMNAIDAIEQATRGTGAVKRAASEGRAAIDDGYDVAREELRALYGAWRDGTAPTSTNSTVSSTSTPVTTTTAIVPTSTTAPAIAATVPTTTTPPTTASTAGIGGTSDTSPPGGGVPSLDGADPTDPPARLPSFLASARWDPIGPIETAPSAAAAVTTVVGPPPAEPGTVLAWVLDPARATTTMVMAGPLVLLGTIARAMVDAGQGLAAPASLLLSLTVVLVMDRHRVIAAVRGEEQTDDAGPVS